MFRYLLIGVTLGLAASAACADAPASASSIPVEAFFSNYKVSSVQISPDGKYLALVVADDATGELNKFLTVVGADDRKIKTSFKVSDDQAIWHYWWADDARVLVATTTQTGALSVPSFDGALYAINVDGSQFQQLLGNIPDLTPATKAPIKDVADNFSHISHKGEGKTPIKR